MGDMGWVAAAEGRLRHLRDWEARRVSSEAMVKYGEGRGRRGVSQGVERLIRIPSDVCFSLLQLRRISH